MSELILASDLEEFTEINGISVSLDEPYQYRLESLQLGGEGAPDSGRIHIKSVLYDKEKNIYCMYYSAHPVFDGDLVLPSYLAYAESIDGINWIKPNLGLFEYNGSKDNNLLPGFPEKCLVGNVILDDDGTYLAPVTQIGAFTKDMVDDPYLKKECDDYMEGFLGIARSRDGFHWEFTLPEKPLIMEKIEVVRLAKFKGKYLINGQQMRPWCDSDVYERMVTTFVSEDLETWKKLPGFYQAKGGVQSHIGIAVTGEFGNTLVGFSGRFYNSVELADMSMEIDLLYAHNGENFHQLMPEKAYMRCGPVGSWNSGSLLQVPGYIEKDDEFIIYFSGGNGNNCPVDGYIVPGYCRIKRHRFAHAGLRVGWDIASGDRDRRGTMKTRLMRRLNPAEKLYLNCSNFRKQGFIRGALCDENGNIFEGFSFDDCIAVTQEGLEQELAWHNQNILPEKFHLILEFKGSTFRKESPYLYAVTLA